MIHWIFDLDNTLYQTEHNNPYRINDGLYLNYSFLKEDKKLKILLNILNGNKIIMTNSISSHCNTVLDKLKIKQCFNHIVTRTDMNSFKPYPKTYFTVINNCKIQSTDKCIFFDDIPINLIMAKKFGWITVLITPDSWKYTKSHNDIDFVFPTVHYAIAFLVTKIHKLNKKL